MTARKGDTATYSRGRVYYIEGVGILFDWGKTVPIIGTADYAPGAIFQHIDGTGEDVLYINEGTLVSCDFKKGSVAAIAALEADLLLDTTPGGASIVGVFDDAKYWTAATVEAILAELGALRYGAGGTAGGRGPSPLIWKTCPILDYMLNPTLGMHYFNDFTNVAVALAAAQAATLLDAGIMGMTGATGATIAQPVDEPNGVIKLLGTTNNMDTAISILGGKNVAGNLVLSAGKKFWFECRLKMTNADNTTAGVFVGLMEQALLTSAAMIAADGTLADKDYVGFHRLEADGDKFDVVYNTASGATSPVVLKADAVTIAAGAYVKIGIYCDGTTVFFYADGVLIANCEVTLVAADFPNDEVMALYIVQMLAATAVFNTNIDWVRIAREF